MDPKNHRLEQREREELAADTSLQQQAVTRKFNSVEDMLRHDAAQNPPPPAVAQRLAESIRREPGPSAGTSWWSRWVGRDRRGRS